MMNEPEPSPVRLEWMRMALTEAERAAAAGDVPVGAVIVDEAGSVIAACGNRREQDGDPTSHAEILALRSAARQRGDWRLDGCTLVVTMEPCPMCAGATWLARVQTLIFGTWNDDYGGCGSRWDVVRDRRLSHRVEVVSGVMESECSELLHDFWQERRFSDRGHAFYSGR